MGCGCGHVKKQAPAFPTKKVINSTAKDTAIREIKTRNTRTKKLFV